MLCSMIFISASVRGIKFRIFNCRTYQNSYTYSDTKLSQKQQKTATEALLLRFCCGATGNRTRDTRIFSPLLYQLSYGTILLFCCPILFVWDCKGRHFFITCKFFCNIFSIFLKKVHFSSFRGTILLSSQHNEREKIHIGDTPSQA